MDAVDRDRLTGRLIWVLGGEEKGTRPAIRQLADGVVGVPRRGRIASLGVAATAAHLLLRTAEIRSKPRTKSRGAL